MTTLNNALSSLLISTFLWYTVYMYFKYAFVKCFNVLWLTVKVSLDNESVWNFQ